MTNKNDFQEYYKSISDFELLDILANEDDYQAEAIVAAKKELLARQIPENRIDEFAKVREQRKQLKHDQLQKIQAIQRSIKTNANKFVETLNPIQHSSHSIDNTIRFIVIALGLIFLFEIIGNYRMHLSYLQDFPRFPLESNCVAIA